MNPWFLYEVSRHGWWWRRTFRTPAQLKPKHLADIWRQGSATEVQTHVRGRRDLSL